jgi:3-hydroxybutyryl-CoA dehydratase
MPAPTVGQAFVATRHVTQERINAYADVSGDHNPLHVDAAFAATTPLGGTVAHGMLVAAWLSALLTSAFGRGWVEQGSLRLRFRSPARPGDTLRLRATVQGVQAIAGGTRLELDLLVANERGEAVISGQGMAVVA